LSFFFQEACARVLLFRGADINIVNKSNKTPYELALVSQNNSIASIIQSHKSEHVVPFREAPLINPKRRSIYIELERDKHRARSSSTTTPSLSLASRSQSMPKLNANQSLRRSQSPITTPTIEHYFQQQHPSSRSSSPKSFSVNSDHGFGSECASHLSSGTFFRHLFIEYLFFYSIKKVLQMQQMVLMRVIHTKENVYMLQHLEENVCVLNLIMQIYREN
jgi:hypothetical protein